MSGIRRKTHLRSIAEAFDMITASKYYIQDSIAAHNAVSDRNKGLITDEVKVVSDNLPAVLELFNDIRRQQSEVQVGESVWLGASYDILNCHYACKDLEKVLKDAYKRLDLKEGALVSESLSRLLSRKGEKAKNLLGIIHESMKRLQPVGIVTDVGLLSAIGEALTRLKSSANAIGLIQGSIRLIENSNDAYSAVQEEYSVPQQLEAVSAQLSPLLDILKNAQLRWQDRMIVDGQVWVDAEVDLTTCRGYCQELADYLCCAYLRLRLAEAGTDAEEDQRILERDIDMAEQHLVEVCACLEPLLYRRIFTDEELLQKIKTLADPLRQKWRLTDDDMED